MAAGQWADHRALHQAQVQRAALRVADAVLLQDASATGSPDPYTSVQYTWVLARWQPPGQPARTGEVLATAGANKGSTVRIWIDRSGAATGPPMDHRDIAGDVVMAVVVTCVVLGLLLLGADSLTRRALDRRRMDAWAAEWRVSGPRWSGRRG